MRRSSPEEATVGAAPISEATIRNATELDNTFLCAYRCWNHSSALVRQLGMLRSDCYNLGHYGNSGAYDSSRRPRADGGRHTLAYSVLLKHTIRS